jgi:hypothetical protein
MRSPRNREFCDGLSGPPSPPEMLSRTQEGMTPTCAATVIGKSDSLGLLLPVGRGQLVVGQLEQIASIQRLGLPDATGDACCPRLMNMPQ